MSTRLLLMTGGGLVALLASVAVAVTIGPAAISTGDVWASVAAHLGFGDSTLTPLRGGIVWNLRMPRTLLAAVCGAGLADLTHALIEQVHGVRAEVTHDPGHPAIRFLRPTAQDGSFRKRSTTSDVSAAT